MKAIELLKEYKSIDFGCNVEELHNEIDEAIEEIHTLIMYKYLADNYLKIEKCKCGVLKVRGYLCPNKECTRNKMLNDNSLKIDIAVTGYKDEDGKYNLLSYDVNIPKEQMVFCGKSGGKE